MPGVRDRMGMLCEQLSRWPSLEGIIREAGAGDALDSLLTAFAQPSGPDPERLDGWIRAMEIAAARAGLAGIASRELAFQPLPAGLGADGQPQVWVCPGRHCDRVVLPDETSGVPVCKAAGSVPLREFPARSE